MLRCADAASGLPAAALAGLVVLGVSTAVQTSCGGDIVDERKSSSGAVGGGGGASSESTQAGTGGSTSTTAMSTTVASTTSMAVSSYGPAPTCDDPFNDPPPCALCLESSCCYELSACESGDCGPLAQCTDEECLDVCAGF